MKYNLQTESPILFSRILNIATQTGTECPVNVTQWDIGSGQYDNLKFAVAGKLEVASQTASLNGSISVSPNPANNQIKIAFRLIKAGTVSLSLIDMQGKTVCTPAPVEYPKGANAVPLDVSDLEKGIYFLKVQTGKVSETVKLMIE